MTRLGTYLQRRIILAGHDVQYGKHRTRRSFQESKKFLTYQI
ncbi:DNA-directed RNA polymerase subunit beta domain protein [Streptococcus pneumoniae 2070335]|nr:DNA-directed RNA polymerase subunit beta domain protein [Streptococcus pneumoniae 2070335]